MATFTDDGELHSPGSVITRGVRNGDVLPVLGLPPPATMGSSLSQYTIDRLGPFG